MNKEYAIYPFEVVRITQRHDQGNHLAHNVPFIDVIDFPWDCTGESGKQWMYFHNDFKIIKLLSKEVTNTAIFESVNELYIPYQKEPVKLVLSCCHLDDVIINQLKVGQIIKKGERVSLGKAGATAIHGHMTAGIDLIKPYQTNANGKVCIVCEKGLTPEQAFYIDDTIKIKDTQGYEFLKVPKEEPKVEAKEAIEMNFIERILKAIENWLKSLMSKNK